MAKKAEPLVRVKRSELKNYSRSRQRYLLDMGFVVEDGDKRSADATK